MIGGSAARILRAGSRASVVVEFAIVGPVLFLVTFGAVDLGLILWTQTSLQAVAADAARCGAIGAAACTGSNTVQSYVRTEAATWVMGAMASNLTVNVNGAVNTATCPAMSIATYETVQITSSYLSTWLPSAFANYSIEVCASYPTT